ncbi:YiiX/YebB-like N1pC/P60 family cysteine hydrolase [Thiolapillus sp.]
MNWLIKDGPLPETPLCDFNRLKFELRPCDVLLVEGRSRVAEVIKLITQSPWSHSALYLGRLFDIRDPHLRVCIEAHFEGDPEEQLVLEAVLGKGTIVTPLSAYRKEHLRICRPEGLSADDAQKVLGYAIRKLGTHYDWRQVLDLARFFFPWAILPRRWRSSLFQHNAGGATRTVCSTLLAEAYSEVDFPILPFIDRGEDGSLRLFKRNPKLFAPRDFDYSPYFSIIKYPFLGMNDLGLYRRLPWDKENDFLDEQPPPRMVSGSDTETHASNDTNGGKTAYLNRAMHFAGLRRKEL